LEASTVPVDPVEEPETQSSFEERLPENELKVPPVLHMNSSTAVQLRRRLNELNLPTEGKKQDLFQRYQRFRSFVQVEKDRGGKTNIEELAKRFLKPANGRKGLQMTKLDGVFTGKTHLDLVNELRNRNK